MNCRLLVSLLLVCALSNVQGTLKKRPPICKGKHCGGYSSYYGAGDLGASGYMYGPGAGAGSGAYLGGPAFMTGGLDGGAGLVAGGLDGGAGFVDGGVGDMGMAGAPGLYSGGVGAAGLSYAPGVTGGAGYFPGGSAMGGRWIRPGNYYFPFPGYCPWPSVPVFKINKRWWYCRIWYSKKY